MYVVIIRDGFYSDWLDLHAGDFRICIGQVLLGAFDEDLHRPTRRTVGVQVSVRRTKRVFATLALEPEQSDLLAADVAPVGMVHARCREKKVFRYVTKTMWTNITIAFLIFVGVMLFALDYLIFECGKEGGECNKENSQTRRLAALLALSVAFVLYVYHRFVVPRPEGMRRIARINLKGL